MRRSRFDGPAPIPTSGCPPRATSNHPGALPDAAPAQFLAHCGSFATAGKTAYLVTRYILKLRRLRCGRALRRTQRRTQPLLVNQQLIHSCPRGRPRVLRCVGGCCVPAWLCARPDGCVWFCSRSLSSRRRIRPGGGLGWGSGSNVVWTLCRRSCRWSVG